jgi:PKD repeat protein
MLQTILVTALFFAGSTLAVSISLPGIEEELTEDRIDKLVYSYTFTEPEIQKISILNEDFIHVSLKDCKNYAKTGEPSIPVKPLRILLPQGTTVEGITIITGESIEIESIGNIQLGSKIFPLNDVPPMTLPEAVYDKTQLYPGSLYNNIGIQYFRGYPILHVNLHPVHYHGETGKLVYYPDMSIQLETIETTINPLYRGLESDKTRLITQVDNAFDSPVVESFKITESQDDNILSTSAEYIIITTTQWANEFQDLINARQADGLATMVKTVSDIENEYSGDDTEEDIRLFIKDAYQNMGTNWILLAGDQSYVPARYLYDIDGGDGTLTSDLYYQCLDGNYNYDGDNYYGEKYDGVGGAKIDLYAEVYAGRASVDNTGQIDNFIAKTLAYESYDWGSDSNVEVGNSVGEYLGFGGVSEYAKLSLEINIDHDTDHGQDTHGIPTIEQDYTDTIMTLNRVYEQDGPWSDVDIENDLDEGTHYFNHLGHASPTSCMKWTTSEIFSLDNDKYALWYSQGCHPGQFEAADECIAEAWTLADAGGFAAIMNTGYGYGAWSSTDGPDNRFSREFWDALYYPPEGISRISVANQDSTQDNMWHIDDGHCMYHDAYQNTLFGDPYTVLKGAEIFGADFHIEGTDYPNPGDILHFIDDSMGADSRHWDFGDGDTSTMKNPTHSYDTEGIYEVTLTIYGGGDTDTCTRTVEVWDNWPPEAIATPEFYAGNNPVVCFDGSSSWDPDGTIVSYHWDFDDGGTSDQVAPCHTFTEDGIYDVVLTVTDDGSRSADMHCEIRMDSHTPPETEAIVQGSYGKNGWMKSNAEIYLDASDWTGVDYTKYKIDGGSWITYSGAFQIWTNGYHDIDFYSVDVYGNTEDVKSVDIKIDTVKPTLNVDIAGDMVDDWIQDLMQYSIVSMVCLVIGIFMKAHLLYQWKENMSSVYTLRTWLVTLLVITTRFH